MEKYTATKVSKNNDVVLISNTTIDKALVEISRDALKVDENLHDIIDWTEMIIDVNESIDIQGEWVMKFNNDILYRIDVD